MSTRWGLLGHRDFRLFWFGETTSRFGNGITSVALPLVAVITLDADGTTVGLLTATVWLPWLLFGLPAGAWVARSRPRNVMIACNLLTIPPLVSIPVGAWLGVLTVGWLLAVALLTGTTAVLFNTAFQVYLPALVDRDDLVEGNAKLHGSYSAAQVAGPGAAGIIAQYLGAATGLLADALTFAVSTACLLRIRTRQPAPAAGTREPISLAIVTGLRFVLRDPYLRAIMSFGAIANLALTGYQTIAVVFLINDVGLPPGTVGGIMALAGLGGVLGALVARPLARRLGSARLVLLAQLAAAPIGAVMPLAHRGPSLVLYVISSTSIVAVVVVGNVVLSSFKQGYCPPHLLSRVASTSAVVTFGTIPLGGLLGGCLGSALGNRSALWLSMAVLGLASLPLLASPIRARRDLPVSPAYDLGDWPLEAGVPGGKSQRAGRPEPTPDQVPSGG